MKILLLGSGGREHAFAYKIAQSPLCEALFIAPGNPGTEKHGTNIPFEPTDFSSVERFVIENEIEMVVCGPEDPLVKGLTDFFQQTESLKRVIVIGPTQKGAMLEGSKEFAKAFMKKNGIPTANYVSFSAEEIDQAITYVEEQPFPLVLKADGLAAGKGVIICETIAEARDGLQSIMLDKKFGAAGNKVVIEEFLQGIEMSCFVLADGENYLVLPEAKDYKRIGEGDTGLNTGGMGAISPVPFADGELLRNIDGNIIKPTIAGLVREGINYRGFLYIGLMIVNGNPFVIEYNCRMGDPETQVVIPRVKSDLVELFVAAGEGSLNTKELTVLPYAAVTVVLASEGYPENYEKGKLIENLSLASECIVFQAGTRKRANGDIETNGGRVLSVTAFGRDLKSAKQAAMRNAASIRFNGKYYRRDIGDDVLPG